MTTEIQKFIRDLEEQCAPLEKKLCALYWEMATTGREEIAVELARAERQLKLLFSDHAGFAKLKNWQQTIADPLLQRQVDLLVHQFTGNQLDEETINDLVKHSTEISNVYNNFRAEVDGRKVTNNDLKDMLKKETDSKRRRKIWEATKQIGPKVAEKVRALAKRRNKAAQSLGFDNHFEMALQLQELDPRQLFALFDRLKQATDKPFADRIEKLHVRLAKRFNITREEIMLWHYDDPFAQATPDFGETDLNSILEAKDMLPILRDFYRGIGLGIDDVLERSDLYERGGKAQSAFCIMIDRGNDIRVLANLRPNSYWMSTMLHELGHAAYSKNIDKTLPYFLRDECHIFTTEAMAMMIEQVCHHPEWLHQMLEMEAAAAEEIAPALLEKMAFDKLVIVRWIMTVTSFERELYQNPDQDLNRVWWNLVKKYQLLEKPAGREDPDWAAKSHIATSPCYYQNYLLGELFAAQIVEMLEREALHASIREKSFWNNKEVGRLLKERLFCPGASMSWKQLVPQVTGQELSEKSFVRQFC